MDLFLVKKIDLNGKDAIRYEKEPMVTCVNAIKRHSVAGPVPLLSFFLNNFSFVCT